MTWFVGVAPLARPEDPPPESVTDDMSRLKSVTNIEPPVALDEAN